MPTRKTCLPLCRLIFSVKMNISRPAAEACKEPGWHFWYFAFWVSDTHSLMLISKETQNGMELLAVICCLMMTGGLTGVTYCRINCVPCLFDFFCSESHSQSQQKPVCHSGFFCSALLLGAGICKLESANCYTDYVDASHARRAWYTSFFVELLDAP